MRATIIWPDAAVGLSGWNAGDHVQRPTPAFQASDFVGQHLPAHRLPAAVDVLEGYAGVLYRRHYLELDQLARFSGAPPEAHYADDVWISGSLAR